LPRTNHIKKKPSEKIEVEFNLNGQRLGEGSDLIAKSKNKVKDLSVISILEK
jgi:hypothetical protein